MWLSYNNNYEVSDEGQVRNKITRKILKQFPNTEGYLMTFKNTKVHKIVAQRFLPQPTESNLQVDHIDRNIKNNSPYNLRWVNASVNKINCNIYKNNTSGYKNIVKEDLLYRVQIMRNKIMVFKKRYKTLEEAIKGRDTFISSFL